LEGEINMKVNAEVYDIDLFDTPQSVIDELHANGRHVICYFSAGSWENWRPDASKFPTSVRGRSNGWAGEKWLDIRNVAVLEPLMKARMALAVTKRCDAVEPDNVDGYQNKTGFPLTGADQIKYNKLLAQWAHEVGLLVGLKNDVDQVPKLVDYFDFAVNEECFAYNECNALLAFSKPAAGKIPKAVFSAEYSGRPARFCPKANQMGFSTLKLPISLDGSWEIDCLKSY